MKRRIIKGQRGLSGLNPVPEMTPEEFEAFLLSLAYQGPETPLLKGVRYFGYMLDPIGAGVDYLYNADWTPDWVKSALPYAEMGLMAAAPKVVKGRRGRKPGQRVAPRKRDISAQQMQDNIEAFGEASPRKAGDFHYDRKGNPVHIGDVGRPLKDYSSPIFDWYMASRLPAPTAPAVPESPIERLIGLTRGRRSKQTLETTYRHWDTSSYPKIPKTKSANWRRNYLSQGSAWVKYFKTRMKDYQTTARTSSDASSLIGSDIRTLRDKAIGFRKHLLSNGIDPSEVGLNFDINEYGKGGHYDF